MAPHLCALVDAASADTFVAAADGVVAPAVFLYSLSLLLRQLSFFTLGDMAAADVPAAVIAAAILIDLCALLVVPGAGAEAEVFSDVFLSRDGCC